ncbi:hypothetical protein [Rhodococcus sp. NPDC006774]|jgi:hypothetical protein|uniref:hypothetical protein n=1 Tax=Rhodococcus sp. NPDC006774 TaxID=3157186 RepID=UPI0033C8F1D1
MTALDTRLALLVAEVRTLGIGAATDTADLQLPGVLVGVDSVAYDTLSGEPSIIASLDVLVPDADRAGAYRNLGIVLDALARLPVEAVSSITNAAGQTIGWRALYPLD